METTLVLSLSCLQIIRARHHHLSHVDTCCYLYRRLVPWTYMYPRSSGRCIPVETSTKASVSDERTALRNLGCASPSETSGAGSCANQPPHNSKIACAYPPIARQPMLKSRLSSSSSDVNLPTLQGGEGTPDSLAPAEDLRRSLTFNLYSSLATCWGISMQQHFEISSVNIEIILIAR